MGPIGVVKRLEPFLPGHSVIKSGGAHRASGGGAKSIKVCLVVFRGIVFSRLPKLIQFVSVSCCCTARRAAAPSQSRCVSFSPRFFITLEPGVE